MGTPVYANRGSTRTRTIRRIGLTSTPPVRRVFPFDSHPQTCVLLSWQLASSTLQIRPPFAPSSISRKKEHFSVSNIEETTLPEIVKCSRFFFASPDRIVTFPGRRQFENYYHQWELSKFTVLGIISIIHGDSSAEGKDRPV